LANSWYSIARRAAGCIPKLECTDVKQWLNRFGWTLSGAFLTECTLLNCGLSWSDLKKSLREQSPEETERLSNAIAAGLEDLARAIERDDELRESLNQRLKSWAVELADAQGAGVGTVVAETIQGWDARTVVDQIEAAVGRDLQYIRISGTVIGGLAGLTIHTISIWLFPVK